ncbi:MAG: hypothetical protein BJ554DRAFT_2407 [Olpidium bornovanus]|uniref:Uncharacterized protein n=1 Tax=Olpidium bornovanus TaxID=278681 RepID=A0A8H8DLQ4_9FUNG|nr:MAG: hypothetical protein BJ554DRAFT_2407 [Olpidium bornovanus]
MQFRNAPACAAVSLAVASAVKADEVSVNDPGASGTVDIPDQRQRDHDANAGGNARASGTATASGASAALAPAFGLLAPASAAAAPWDSLPIQHGTGMAMEDSNASSADSAGNGNAFICPTQDKTCVDYAFSTLFPQ